MICKEEFRRIIARNLVNFTGWCTNRKIVVIESDDWGSIRMPSKHVYDKLLKNGLRVDKCPYNQFDTLADSTDLSSLFEVLSSVKDKNGNHPVLTANSVVANPDFEKIRESNFQTYYYEPFTETLKRDKRTEGAFAIWQQGMSANLFRPQFHGREHLNVSRWMTDLRAGVQDTCLAFDYGVFGLTPSVSSGLHNSYMAAMDYTSEDEKASKSNIIESGLLMFNEIFGYPSKSYIATNYIWGNELNEILAKNGVRILQGQKKQGHPQINNDRKYIRRHTGDVNNFGQVYLVRNCMFEPSLFPEIEMSDYCLLDIQNSFFWKRPAIVSSHRLNFMGGIVPKNGYENLKILKSLLLKIVNKWPDVEFMSSVQLGDLIKNELK